LKEEKTPPAVWTYFREIGHRFGITREWVRQLQNAALAKLRKMLDQLEADPQ